MATTTTMRHRATTRQHTRKRAPKTTRSHRPASAAKPRQQAQVQRLLDRLSTALTSGDGRTAAECFEQPALMVMAEGNQPLDDPSRVAEFFGSSFQQYNDQGVYDTYAEIEEIDWLTPDVALVHTHWPYLDDGGQDVGDAESSVYVVKLRPREGPVIAAAITLGKDSERPGRVSGKGSHAKSGSRRAIRSPSRRS